MFSHVAVGSDDLAKSKRFYDALFEIIGCDKTIIDLNQRLMYWKNGQFLLVTKPVNGKPTAPGNGNTLGFALNSKEDVDRWFKAGKETGGTPIEDPPGIRDPEGLKRYVAYLRDPFGTKLCGFHLIKKPV
ncbi:hypothetical protein COMNV_00864 [Commensalibacter sp. Nvir]|uniref:VOC family protein n=1 Tax=Commensalibacter sp. Nvir TaxID=3069817 RepID=UPI002D3F438C|nr:hypothetical protein COMNV_00864 [Commensalibacter sp. Nvir]